MSVYKDQVKKDNDKPSIRTKYVSDQCKYVFKNFDFFVAKKFIFIANLKRFFGANLYLFVLIDGHYCTENYKFYEIVSSNVL